MKLRAMLFLACLLTALTTAAMEHGTVKVDELNNFQIWNDSLEQWTDVESFWLRYADSNGGLTWGRSSEYPEYSKVKEHDTLIIELKQGPCLMEFFHKRWRRANDVRRWDKQLSDYGGCSHVFD